MTTTKTKTSGLQRRDFLKLMGAGLASGWVLSASSAPFAGWFAAPQVNFGAAGLLRGSQNGQIFQSLDQGKTWQLLASLGEHLTIINLVTRAGQVYVKMSLAGNPFWLVSSDAKTWRTAG